MKVGSPPRTFQELIFALQRYWSDQGCVILQPADMEMGAGTFHTATFLRAIGPEPWSAAYVQPSRRPKDGRYGENPNRLQHFYQYQVVMKPSPGKFQEIYLGSLQDALGIDPRKNDIRFVGDGWGLPTLGGSGLGLGVWLNGMEITQFTYFQQVGGLECKPVLGELTYGLERLAMYLQGKESVFDLVWVDGVTYGDVYHQNEVEQSKYNFELANTEMLFQHFGQFESEAKRLMQAQCVLPAYEMVLKCSHTFNLLDARGAISTTERAAYIGRVRNLARSVAQSYYESREKLGFPMAKPQPATRKKARAGAKANKKMGKTGRTETLLVELLTEELPPKALSLLAKVFADEVANALVRAQLKQPASDCRGLSTPRRIAVLAPDVQAVAQDRKSEIDGPSTKAPPEAVAGFAKKHGIDVKALGSRETPKGTVYVAHVTLKGAVLDAVLAEIVREAVRKLPIPKTMRWGDGEAQFVRPVHGLVMLHGSRVVPGV